MPRATGRLVLALPILAAAASPGRAAAQAASPDAGRASYAACAPCHGPRAEGNPALGGPSLAGQIPAYLTRQLESFRSGVRGAAAGDAEGAKMGAVAAGLSDPQIRDVVAYIATLPDPVTPKSVAGDLKNGSNYYQMKCNACHGARAEGNALLGAPRLAGASDAYLLRQLASFRSGLRGGGSDDRPGRQMAMMARTLPDEKTDRDVVAFVRSLAPGAAAAPGAGATR